MGINLRECAISGICGTFLDKIHARASRFSAAGYPRASQSHGSGMAEDIRAVLPQLYPEHPEQHGLETTTMAEHDFHLERGVVLIAVVGQVGATENSILVALYAYIRNYPRDISRE